MQKKEVHAIPILPEASIGRGRSYTRPVCVIVLGIKSRMCP